MSKKEVFHSTVGQLVEFLKTLPQDLPVLTSGYENGFENEPENEYYEGEFQVAEDGGEETFDAVVIRRVVRDE
jgi:hypothetical protein